MVVAVGGEDEGALAELLLQAAGVKLGLLLATLAWRLVRLVSTTPSGLPSSPHRT
jgi:hypothetical protein